MARYIIFIVAILAGALVGWWLSRPKPKAADTILVQEAKAPKLLPWPQLLPWIIGGLVLIVGLVILADFGRAPKEATYSPAVVIDGQINPGNFK